MFKLVIVGFAFRRCKGKEIAVVRLSSVCEEVWRMEDNFDCNKQRPFVSS